MTYKTILQAIPTLHAAQLVNKLGKKKKKKKGLLGDFVDVGVGVPLIQAESQFIGAL